jgi:outer membrane protein assembly factor BamB
MSKHRFVIAIVVGAVFARSPLVFGQVDVEEARSAGLRVYWKARIPLPLNAKIQRIDRVEEYLYASDSSGGLYALRAKDGVIDWAAVIADPNTTIMRPSHSGPYTVVSTGKRVVILKRNEGRVLRQHRTPFAPSSSAVGFENGIYVGSHGRHLNRMRMGDGRVDWQARTDGAISADPLLIGSRLFIASQGGVLYHLKLGKVEPIARWRFRTFGPIYGTPQLAEDGLYIASQDRSIYCLDPMEGVLKWQRRIDLPLRGGAVVGGDNVYVFVVTRGINAFDRSNGEPKWQAPAAASLLAFHKQSCFLKATTGDVVVVDSATGREQHRLPVGDFSISTVETRSPAIFLASEFGELACLTPHDVPYLSPDDLSKQQVRLVLAEEEDAEPGEDPGDIETLETVETESSSEGAQTDVLKSSYTTLPLFGRSAR